MPELRQNWAMQNLPLIMVAVAGIAWGVRLEERMANHLSLPYHDGMRQQRDDLIEIKAELRFLREDVLELRENLTPRD
tara:strand:+ start:254 stop:487 length:234 start_codon:yes stop_codon:yes gene_type:complete